MTLPARHLQFSSPSTQPNLLDVCPPFQIDGNFGGTAGIAEMLLQSQAGRRGTAAGLAEGLADGKVTGLRARGGYEVDIEWSGSRLTRAVIRGVCNAQPACSVRYGQAATQLPLPRAARSC